MADETVSDTPAKLTRRQLAILWGECADDAERKALVAKYPELRTIFSEAGNF